ncbi:MAG: methyltransferase domain-containing protein [Chloroflexi bacterium]|nr:methyltransferase domain-containing protein [Chloroflexota bacterium]
MSLFDGLASRYDAWFETPLGRAVDAVEQQALFAVASVDSGDLILDVGCGTGHYAQALDKRGARVVGIDLSAAMLAAAQAKGIGGAAFAGASALRLPFPDATFDEVIAVTLLEFLSDREAAVVEMLRVLRPDGRLVVAVLNRQSLWYWLYWRGRGVYTQAHLFTSGELRRLLAVPGVERAQWRAALFFPPWQWLADNPAGRAIARLLEAAGPRLWPKCGAFLVGSAVKVSDTGT